MFVFKFSAPCTLKACGYCHYEHDRKVSLDKRQRLLLNGMDAWSNRICLFGSYRSSENGRHFQSNARLVQGLDFPASHNLAIIGAEDVLSLSVSIRPKLRARLPALLFSF